MQVIPPLWQKGEEELKSFLMNVKVESKKIWLKTQKTKIMASGSITSWQNRWKKIGNNDRLFSWTPKSLRMVTSAKKLKDTCSLGEKLWPT